MMRLTAEGKIAREHGRLQILPCRVLQTFRVRIQQLEKFSAVYTYWDGSVMIRPRL